MPEPSPDDRARIEAAARGGRMIEAIKLYREATGASLLDAKHAVEAMVPPEQRLQMRKGCGVTAWLWALFFLTLVVTIGVYVYALTRVRVVRNVGPRAVLIVQAGKSFVVEPGTSASVGAGGELLVHPGTDPASAPRRMAPANVDVSLGADGVLHVDPTR